MDLWRSDPLDKNPPWSVGISKSLQDYLKISKNLKLARFKLAYYLEVLREKINTDWANINKLWGVHHQYYLLCQDLYFKENIYNNQDNFSNYYKKLQSNKRPEFSFLDLKIKLVEKIMETCHLCERRCGVDRSKYAPENLGYCKSSQPLISSEFMHIGEEPPLVPSHTIFFSGCTFNCAFCQNWNISQGIDEGKFIPEKKLAHIIDQRRKQGSLNVNFVGGDPTPHLAYILRTLSLCKENIPIIWNSNFYMSEEAMQLLQGVVDLYLSDFKYGKDQCAHRLSDVKNYWNVVTRNHLMAKESGDLIIRHLVLPNHVECCTKPILTWIKEHLGEDTVVNIMGQYHPAYKAYEYPEISRFPYQTEMEEAFNSAKQLGLKNLI